MTFTFHAENRVIGIIGQVLRLKKLKCSIIHLPLSSVERKDRFRENSFGGLAHAWAVRGGNEALARQPDGWEGFSGRLSLCWAGPQGRL